MVEVGILPAYHKNLRLPLTTGDPLQTEVIKLLLNLKAEMARRAVTPSDMAKTIGKTERTVKEKIEEKTQFGLPEAVAVRDKFFTGLSLEYLFAPELGWRPNTPDV